MEKYGKMCFSEMVHLLSNSIALATGQVWVPWNESQIKEHKD